MNYYTKTFSTALGSLLALFPAQGYSQPPKESSVSQRINKHWMRTGQYLKSSIDTHGTKDGGE